MAGRDAFLGGEIDSSAHLKCVKCRQLCEDPVLQECPHPLCLRCAIEIHNSARSAILAPNPSPYKTPLKSSRLPSSSSSPFLPPPQSPLMLAAQGLAGAALLCPLPSCRTATPLGPEGPQGLRRNVLLRRVIARYKEANPDLFVYNNNNGNQNGMRISPGRSSIGGGATTFSSSSSPPQQQSSLPLSSSASFGPGAVRPCQLCEDNVATVHCTKCEVFYCDACRLAAHPPRGQFLRHPLEKAGGAVISQSRCEEHPKYEKDFWCEQCREPVCAMCLLSGAHFEHPRAHISMATQNWKVTLQQALLRGQDQEHELALAIERVHDTAEAVKEEHTILMEQLKEQRDVLLGMLKRRMDKMMATLTQKKDLKTERLEQQMLRLRKNLDMCVGAVHGAQDILESEESNSYSFVSGVSEYYKALVAETEKPIESVPCVAVDFGVRMDFASQRLALEQMALHETSSVCAAMCTAEGVGLVRGAVDVFGTFEVKIADVNGVIVDGRNRVKPFIQILGPDDIFVTVEIVDKANGCYDCRYLPTQAGEYSIHILVRDDHICGSPFHISVVAALSK